MSEINKLKTSKLEALNTAGFLISLSILLLNDFYLKQQLANWLTGKISDFTGLFVFGVFWIAIFPRFRFIILFSIAFLFIFWKSIYSQPFINLLNKNGLPFTRVVDYTDLVAITMLPTAYYYTQRKFKNALRFNHVFTGIIACFSFLATSYYTEIPVSKEYNFSYSLDSLKTNIFNLKYIINYEREKIIDDINANISNKQSFKFYNDTFIRSKPVIDKFVRDTMALFIYEDFCFKGYEAKIIVSGDESTSKINLIEFNHRCPEDKKDKEKLLELFESKIISQLK